MTTYTKPRPKSHAPARPTAKPAQGEMMGLPQDYARPTQGCDLCGNDRWKERTKAQGGGWFCGACH